MTPIGRAPVDRFRFRSGPRYDASTGWRLQLSADAAFTAPLLRDVSAGAAFITNGLIVDWPYDNDPVLSVGTTYWWRARWNTPTVGPWSQPGRFTPDPAATPDAYAAWAQALLGTLGLPRPLRLLGAMLPVGPQVAQILTLPWAGRIQVRDDAHPPATDQIVGVVGVKMHLDITGWEVETVTTDIVAAP
jgi:hypothetical protein